MPPQIVAAGGLLPPDSGNSKLERYILEASGRSRPRICFVPTASGDDVQYIARFFETYARLGVEAEILRFFHRTPENLRDYLAGFDVVQVGGGNTRSMLAVWRHWGFGTVLRDAWQRGTVLCGSSAGAICWFEFGLTDSVAGPLLPVSALGFLAGSYCPHYDGEAERRPAYERFIRTGEIENGYACDDGAALHFVGAELRGAVAARPAANAYRVERCNGEAVQRELAVLRLP